MPTHENQHNAITLDLACVCVCVCTYIHHLPSLLTAHTLLWLQVGTLHFSLNTPLALSVSLSLLHTWTHCGHQSCSSAWLLDHPNHYGLKGKSAQHQRVDEHFKETVSLCWAGLMGKWGTAKQHMPPPVRSCKPSRWCNRHCKSLQLHL